MLAPAGAENKDIHRLPVRCRCGLAGGGGSGQGLQPACGDPCLPRSRVSPRREMRMTGVLLDVDVSRDGVVLVDMADAVKAHLVMAARANHAVAVDHPIQRS